MRQYKRYQVDVGAVHRLNKDGYSLPEISEKLNVPQTTLNRYLHQNGYPAEVHEELISIALLKSSKLLGTRGGGNQQPSRVCSRETRDSEGSTTTSNRKVRGTNTGVLKRT